MPTIVKKPSFTPPAVLHTMTYPYCQVSCQAGVHWACSKLLHGSAPGMCTHISSYLYMPGPCLTLQNRGELSLGLSSPVQLKLEH